MEKSPEPSPTVAHYEAQAVALVESQALDFAKIIERLGNQGVSWDDLVRAENCA